MHGLLLLLHLPERLLHALEVLVAAADGEERALPLEEELLFALADLVHLLLRLFQHLLGCAGLILLGVVLGAEEVESVLKELRAPHEVLDQQVLLLLLALELLHLLFGLICRSPRDRDLPLHLLVVRLHLLEGRGELVEFGLELRHPPRLLADLDLFFVVLFHHVMSLLLSLLPQSSHGVEVVVCLLKCELHARKLLLDAIQLNADVLLLLL
mmetsp:Transcript_59333/g.139769  ORF Transcript_59333/g.139769 Transcript_59333/m.139769 type:complete len:212 (+) Transcript_59333:1907-2542(+)